VHALTRNSSVR